MKLFLGNVGVPFLPKQTTCAVVFEAASYPCHAASEENLHTCCVITPPTPHPLSSPHPPTSPQTCGYFKPTTRTPQQNKVRTFFGTQDNLASGTRLNCGVCVWCEGRGGKTSQTGIVLTNDAYGRCEAFG